MRSDEHDRLVEAAIVWNQPLLRRSDDAGARAFSRALDGRPPDPSTLPLSGPLGIAARGLASELHGEMDQAREIYATLVERDDLSGLLGALLLAWLEEASEDEFNHVEMRLGGMPDIQVQMVARVHSKLMTWSLDRGWRERARHHWYMAHQSARGDLRKALDSVGDWFADSRVIHVKPPMRSNLVLYPWVTQWVSEAAKRAVEESLKDRVRSPWTKSWRFEGPAGSAIQIAELQANWAGALWLLPPIYRQHASLLLQRAEASDDVTRGVGLWIRGGGADPLRLIQAFEGEFGVSSAADLLSGELGEGRKVKRPEAWFSSCLALWDQMPYSMVQELVRSAPIPNDWEATTPGGTDEVRLFAVLSLRDPDGWLDRLSTLDSHATALVARSMGRAVALRLSGEAALQLLQCTLSEPMAETPAAKDWQGTGWSTIAALYQALPRGRDRRKLADRLNEVLPDAALPDVVEVAPDVVAEERIKQGMQQFVRLVESDRKEAEAGTVHGRARNPHQSLATLLIAASGGSVKDKAVRALARSASAPKVPSDQRVAALDALRRCADAALVGFEDIMTVLDSAGTSSGQSGGWPFTGSSDLRLEKVARMALALSTQSQQVPYAMLIAACRDPDVRVRELAVRTTMRMSVQELAKAVDSALIGALYDPDPSVQALGAEAVLSGRVGDQALRAAGSVRLREMWQRARRDVRVAIAWAIAGSRDPEVSDLQKLARKDRSWLVRDAAN